MTIGKLLARLLGRPDTVALERTRSLAIDYLDAIDVAIGKLVEHFGDELLLRGVRTGRIPREGAIPGARYWFHGGGCQVTLEPSLTAFRGRTANTREVIVEFDFEAGSNRVTHFSSWFFEGFVKSVDTGLDTTTLTACVRRLERAGVIDELLRQPGRRFVGLGGTPAGGTNVPRR
ncbi:MAG: hypothetical protein U0414_29630 [Polyangiaceae bacterium]